MSVDQGSLDARAKAALKKAAKFGEDIDLEAYRQGASDIHVKKMEELSEVERQTLLNVGVVPTEAGRSGSMVVMDNSIVHTHQTDKAFELLSTKEALKKYDWLREYSWNAVPVDADKYTATSYLENANGYTIIARKGMKSKLPIQTCLMITNREVAQTVHNIIVVEEGAELEVVTGCTTKKGVEKAIHMGISEFYIHKNAKMTFTMIHNWAEQVGVRPRTAVIVDEGATFVNNYVILKPVKSVQAYPTMKLVGRGAVGRFSSVAVAHTGSHLDLGSRVVLSAPEARAEIISRSITMGGTAIARGQLIGESPGIKAHLECKGLILSKTGSNIAIPELEAHVPDVEMTHEAAVGKIAQDQVEYIMSRGLTEDEAVGMIVRGFLEVGIRGIPEELKAEIDKAINVAEIAKG